MRQEPQCVLCVLGKKSDCQDVTDACTNGILESCDLHTSALEIEMYFIGLI